MIIAIRSEGNVCWRKVFCIENELLFEPFYVILSSKLLGIGLPHWEDISNQQKHKESVTSSNRYFCKHPFAFITTPEYWTRESRKDKCHPYHQCISYTAIFRNSLDNTSKPDNHKKWCNEFCKHQFPHTLHQFFILFFCEFFITVMYLHPEFSKNGSMPYCTTHKHKECTYSDSKPIKIHIHILKEKE